MTTPKTRSAAAPASRFSRRLPTVPRKVTLPPSAETAIDVLSTLGSQKSSSRTSRATSSFEGIEWLLSLGLWSPVVEHIVPKPRSLSHRRTSPALAESAQRLGRHADARRLLRRDHR